MKMLSQVGLQTYVPVSPEKGLLINWNTNAAVTVSSNGTFVLENITVRSNAAWWVQLHCDLDTNGVWSSFDALLQTTVEVIGETNRAVLVMDEDSVVDRDGDGMNDAWEITYGLSWTNAMDIYGDLDGDGLDNLWEFDLGLVPTIVDTGYVHSAVALAVDQRIAGANPSNALPIFAVQDHANTNYVRSTNCWAADVDLTCASPWNTDGGTNKPGTLISPRHVLFVAHAGYYVSVGESLRFVDATNGVLSRTVSGLSQVGGTDLVVGILDSDLPTNRISFARVLPPDYWRYFGDGARLPAIGLNQCEDASVFNLRALGGATIHLDKPAAGKRAELSKNIVPGDSGNPSLFLVGETPVLATLWTWGQVPWAGGSGFSVAYHADAVTATMTNLNSLLGITNGYELTTVDLSGFTVIDNSYQQQGAGQMSSTVSVDDSGGFPVYVVSVSE